MADLINILRDGTAQAVAPQGNYMCPQADQDLYPCIPSIFSFSQSDHAGTFSKTLPSDSKSFRIVGIKVLKTAGAGGAGDTVQVKVGASACSDAISLNAGDKAVIQAASIDDAHASLVAGSVLAVTIVDGNAGATDLSCRVDVYVVRV